MKIAKIYPWLNDYLMAKKGVTQDFQPLWNWTRYFIGGKMFAAFCCEDEERTLFTVKCDPLLNTELRQQYKDIIPAYYMNKEHWNSVNIPGKVPDDIIKMMSDSGYSIVFNSLTKKLKDKIDLL